MKVYLAARLGRYREMEDRASELRQRGHMPTSRWHSVITMPGYQNRDHWQQNPRLEQAAVEDLSDIDEADALVLFTESGPQQGGGRHFEAGYAYARSKWLLVLGPREQVFLHLSLVCVFSSWNDLVEALDHGDSCAQAWRRHQSANPAADAAAATTTAAAGQR
jgi:hypothetical protein